MFRSLGVLCLLATISYGQSVQELVGWPPHQVIGVEQGLPQAFVSGLAQDDWGFIWVGTLGGVARYDGRRMVPFQHHPDEPTSPRSNIVIWLERGGPNEIWLRYENGLIDRMNAQTGQCQHYPTLDSNLRILPGNRQFHVDNQGNLWGLVLNEGVFRYDVRRNQFLRYRRATHGLVSDTVNTLAEDRQGRIWAISPTGFSRFSADGRPIQSSRFRSPLVGLREMVVNDERIRAFVRPNGEVMFNNQTNLVFVNPRTMATRLVAFATHKLAVDQPLLHQTADNRVYLVAGGKLYQYEDSLGITTRWYYQPPYGEKFGGLQETGLLLDRSGVLWMGANTKGLFRIDLAAPRLQAYRYQSEFCTDALQTGLGLNLSAFFQWPFKYPKTASSYHFRTTYDPQGRLWMSIGTEIGYYSFQTRTFTHLPDLGFSKTHNSLALIRGMAVLPNGQVWVLSQTGTLYQYHPSERRWQASTSRLTVEARQLVADTSYLWATTGGSGLLRYDIRTHRYQTIHFDPQPGASADEPLLGLHQDRTHPDWLWIGSHRGLLGFNKRTGRFRRFTTSDGLPNNTVYAILPDREGYFWLSTNRGLCRFDPVKHTTFNISRADGLPGEEFNRFHHLQLPDGRLAFGGIEGWVLFDPAQIKAERSRPLIMLTGLTINNQLVNRIDHPTLVPPALNTLRELRLAHYQNYLTVDFAALNGHQPSRMTYRYKLEGYDADWSTTTQPTVGYTQLPPGHFTLRISAINTTGEQNPPIRELAIIVSPPTWASRWAYALYTLLLGTVGWAVVRFRAVRTRERRELILRQRQADELRQLDEAKTRFFTNVSHELRTPLTLMLAPLRSVLNRHRLEAQDEKFLRMVDRTAGQLLGLVNELLDLNRLEAGKVSLQLQTVALNDFLADCLLSFTEQARQFDLALRSELVPDNTLCAVLDVNKLKRVIQNLLANALKFTPPGGTVTLRATIADDRLRIDVIDTGRGIHPNDLPHIFDRYFQAQEPGLPLEGGTGIGLALCQELTRLMQGTITVSSSPGQGSLFCVDLPLVVPKNPAEGANEQERVDRLSGLASLPDPNSSTEQNDPILATPLNADALKTEQLVLLVEDNADLRAYLTAVLPFPLRVKTAANGQVALQLLAELPQRPALIIADLMMPIMDGWQLLEALKAHPTYRTIPVVILTARADMADKLRALRLGVDDYLLKPFDEVELTARVSNLLRNQQERLVQSAVIHADLEPNAEAAPEPAAVSADDLAWLERLEALTYSRLEDFELTVDTLADELAMTRRTFYRTVKRLTGMTPAQYIAEARFHQARLLLETRQVTSVKQVAYRVGYRQVSHFAQLYQQRFGKSPSNY